MNDHANACEGAFESLLVTHISQKVAYSRSVEACRSHFMLLQFIPAENDQLAGLKFTQHDLHESPAKGAGATGNQYHFLRPVHLPSSLETAATRLYAVASINLSRDSIHL